MLKKLHNLKSRKGFTLVELIIVIAIIAVLAAILIPTMMGFVKNSRITSNISSAQSISNSISIAIADNFEKNGVVFDNAIVSLTIKDGAVTAYTSGTTAVTTGPVFDAIAAGAFSNTTNTFKTGVAMIAIVKGAVVGVGYDATATARFALPDGTVALDDYGALAVARECTVARGFSPAAADPDVATHTKNKGLMFYSGPALAIT